MQRNPVRGGTARSLLRGWPTLVVIGLLGVLAWAGHHVDWKVPSFAEVLGNHQKDKDDWCEQHAVPESECVECNPSLFARPEQYGFCEIHGVHQCPFEHPELAQLARCPTITQADLDRAQRALTFKERPENDPGCKQHQRLLQFASEAILNKMGVGVDAAIQKDIAETVSASGEFTFEQARVTPLYTVVSGRVWQMTPLGVLGAQVKKGDVLALVDALEAGKARAEFLHSFTQVILRRETFARLTDLFSKAAVSERNVREAEAEFREATVRHLAAQQALINLGLPVRPEDVKDVTPEQLAGRMALLGLPPDVVKQLDAANTTANLLPIRASKDGTVIDVKITDGEVVDPTRTLFVVADASRMCLVLNVRQEDVQFLRVADVKAKSRGNRVLFQPDGGGPTVKADLTLLSKLIDEKNRTLQVRATVIDPPAALAAHTFGKAQIIVREEPHATVVPTGSIHWEGDCHVVFVRDKNWFKPGSPKVFHVRPVRPGVTSGPWTEVIAGLLPGEIVASKNSSALRAELLKNNLGAG
jgi:membrane fusion protein, heavy metal efflux system